MTRPIRLRSLLLGAGFGLGITAITPYFNVYLGGTPLGGGHFPLAPFFIVSWLFMISAVVARLFKGYKLLTGIEMLVTWILMVVVSGISYTGLARTFFFNVTAPHYFANAANRWEEVLHPLLPQSWYPADPAAIETLFNGLENGRDMGIFEVLVNVPWGVWLPPLITWGLFILLCYGVMLCLVNLFGNQWVVNERVNFPLLRLPQMMAESFDEGAFGKFLGNKYLLMGLVLVVFLHTVNGLNFYYPSVPRLPTLFIAGTYFPKFGLFSGYHNLKIYIYPAFIGFAFLTTRQISFSFWFFFLLGGLSFGLLSAIGIQVPAAALGTTFGPSMARPEEAQVIGATVVFFFFLVWLGRQHFGYVILRSVGLRGKVDSAEQGTLEDRGLDEHSAEWFPAPLAFWGAVLGLALLSVWCWVFGMPPLPAIVTPIVLFAFSIVASRIVCQGGVPYFTLTAAPLDGTLAAFGSKFFGGVGLVVAMVMQKMLFLDLRESLMPSLFHASKVGEEVKARRLFFLGLVVMLTAAVAVSFLAMLYLAHKYGIRDLRLDWASRTTLTMYESAQRLVEVPSEGSRWIINFSLVGAAVMLVLVLGYYRFVWWPIHPLGYLMAYSSAMDILWFSFFVGWLCNHLCLHYGGTALFRKVRNVFLGFILADFLMGGLYAIIGMITGMSYQVFPA
ncbi:hypothetical protein DPQ33_01785 [Oceanidesulfovibrio indonesiensis]|uniref:Peptide transporter n=1 Tax=Oceanidesulfovibrio indonesiensis TaxID=54767 RepID=A0A7M3MKQ5_9BACT|nr:DUF6785 family protein [Oceanidesulfovibrio indonesiensis]TVM19982.1 hypothetical protein DPQ33_01785 [Oceanidesulfovibrio indonesiensis]